jgi:hypothetical protein
MSISEVLNSLDLMFIIIKMKKLAQIEYIKENNKCNKKQLIKELNYITGNYIYSENTLCSYCGISYNLKISRKNCENNDICLKCIIKLYMNELYI